MSKILRELVIIVICILGCSKSEIRRNPHIPEAKFKIVINTNLALYNDLKVPLKPVVIKSDGAGINGIVVINTGRNYVAWELSCPHIPLGECSSMVVKDIFAICECDGTKFNLVNGGAMEKKVDYMMLNYSVSVNGSVITIFN